MSSSAGERESESSFPILQLAHGWPYQFIPQDKPARNHNKPRGFCLNNLCDEASDDVFYRFSHNRKKKTFWTDNRHCIACPACKHILFWSIKWKPHEEN